MAVSSYSTSTFNNLPKLREAGEDFNAKDGNDLVTRFRDLFLQHKMERVFGLRLLHRHFDLFPNERLVEYRGTSVPWSDPDTIASPNIRPSNWVLAEDGNFQPYEFLYSTDNATSFDSTSLESPECRHFIDAVKDLLYETNATNIFGLCSYPGDDHKATLEITEGRANINLDPEHVSLNPFTGHLFLCFFLSSV